MSDVNIPLHVVFIEAWVKKGDKYLLAKRSSKDDQAAGKWAVPGGKVDMELEDKIVENALKREVKEEVGIEVGNFQFLASRSFIRSSGHHVVALSFVVDYKSGEAMPLEDQDEIRWVKIEEMEHLFDDHWKDILNSLKNFDKKNN
ncbi:MAG: NUDIX domain-containing protein [bacterium]|nr:NUDIX domain-containing protein [bacterium]